jgi:hypothetical protein
MMFRITSRFYFLFMAFAYSFFRRDLCGTFYFPPVNVITS